MALNDNAVFTAAKGYILTSAVDAVAPTEQEIFDFVDETTVLTGYTIIGYTSRDDLPEFGFDGGDTEARGTWQNEALRTVVTDPAVDYVTFNLVQFDATTLEMYYGRENTADPVTSPGTYAMGEDTSALSQAGILIILVDGANKIAFHASKVDLRREDAISLAVDEFGTLPMRASILKSSGKPRLSWIPGVNTTP